MDGLQISIFLLTALAGMAVVATRDPLPQSMLASVYSILLAILFIALQAPDVALSELIIGAVAYPLMLLAALAKTSGKGAE